MAARTVSPLNTDRAMHIARASNLDYVPGLADDSMSLVVTSHPYIIGKSYEKRILCTGMWPSRPRW